MKKAPISESFGAAFMGVEPTSDSRRALNIHVCKAPDCALPIKLQCSVRQK